MRTFDRAWFAVVAIVLGVWVSPAAGENWPCFRGPGRQGISGEKNVPVKWSAAENVAWKTEIEGEGWSSPIVVGDRVFVTAATEAGASFRLVALDRKTGAVLWNTEVFRQKIDNKMPQNSYASATPATDGKRVYVLAADGSIGAVSMSGEKVWEYRQFEYYSQHGLGVSPVLYDGLVIVPFDWSSRGPEKKVGWQIAWDQSFIVALNADTGKEQWRAKRGLSRIAHVTPQIVETGTGVELVSAAGDVLQGFDLKTGELLWTATSPGEGVVPSVVAGEGLVFSTTGFNESWIRAVRPGRRDRDAHRLAHRSGGSAYTVAAVRRAEPLQPDRDRCDPVPGGEDGQGDMARSLRRAVLGLAGLGRGAGVCAFGEGRHDDHRRGWVV